VDSKQISVSFFRHHRRLVTEKTGMSKEELDYTAKYLLNDPKNYHVWAYRVWIARTFEEWDQEMALIATLMDKDIRKFAPAQMSHNNPPYRIAPASLGNNSAWNHRFTVIQHSKDGFTADKLKAELE